MTKTRTANSFLSIKQYFAVLALCTIAHIGFTTPHAFSADLDEIRDRGYMMVATEDNYAPWMFTTNGEPDGLIKDLLSEFRSFSGLEIRQEIVPFTGFLAAITAGQYDMGFTVLGVTAERLKTFNYSPPVGAVVSYALHRKGDPTITDLRSLSNKRVGGQQGSSTVARLPQLEAMLKEVGGNLGTFVGYIGHPEALADLIAGRIDFVVIGLDAAREIMAARPDEFEISEFPVSGPAYLALPIPKSSPQLLQLVTEFMVEVNKSGRFAEVQRKWLGEERKLPLNPITDVSVLAEMERSFLKAN